MSSRFSRTPTCDRQTDRQTDTDRHRPIACIYRASIASRGKTVKCTFIPTLSAQHINNLLSSACRDVIDGLLRHCPQNCRLSPTYFTPSTQRNSTVSWHGRYRRCELDIMNNEWLNRMNDFSFQQDRSSQYQQSATSDKPPVTAASHTRWNVQVSAAAEGPARRATSRPQCCTHRVIGRTVINWRLSSVELSWQHLRRSTCRGSISLRSDGGSSRWK